MAITVSHMHCGQYTLKMEALCSSKYPTTRSPNTIHRSSISAAL